MSIFPQRIRALIGSVGGQHKQGNPPPRCPPPDLESEERRFADAIARGTGFEFINMENNDADT